MYEYLALSILILSEGVVSQSQDDVFCTIGTGNGINGGKTDILRIDEGVLCGVYLQ